MTVVHVSHRADEALRIADRVAVLADGTLRQLASPATVVRQPADATVARLVGYENVVAAEADSEGRMMPGCPAARQRVPARDARRVGHGHPHRPPADNRLAGTVERVSPARAAGKSSSPPARRSEHTSRSKRTCHPIPANRSP